MPPAISQPPISSRPGLAVRFGIAFLVFVVAGSLLLLAWLGAQERVQSARLFAALAKADADFIRELKLPRSEKLASDLGRLLKMEVFFRDRSGRLMPPGGMMPPAVSAPAHVEKLGDGREALALRLDDEHDVIFVRATVAGASITQPGTLGALTAFWVLSLALGWSVSQGVVRPLANLTRRLPRLFGDAPPDIPEATRTDEIGQLAAALLDARTRLGEERLLREQSEKLALLGRMAAGLAHEIKNPLAAIQLHAQLADYDSLDPEAKKSLAMIKGESRVIEGLVNQWLYVARPAPPGTSPLDARDVLLQTIEAVHAQAEHAGVKIVQHLPDALPVRGDRHRLAQAFRNLAINAIQAMPTGGTLTIAGSIDHRSCRVTFADTGPGFSDRALKSAADLFFSEREGGLGIGLNLVKEVVTHHGGTLSLANGKPVGAVVAISLPKSGGS
ncbi:MAG: HAMP domain-containing histidine kinase [Verrucomicrobiaceae bacterium]|nr:HAMP domain-containing histidine kinase [Verrucomicrobiaceae bacterium]